MAALALAGMGAFAAPAQAACPPAVGGTITVTDDTCPSINFSSFPGGTNLLVTPTGVMSGPPSLNASAVGTSVGQITIQGTIGSSSLTSLSTLQKITIAAGGQAGAISMLTPDLIWQGGIENNGRLLGSVFWRGTLNGSIVNNGFFSGNFVMSNAGTMNGDIVNNNLMESPSGNLFQIDQTVNGNLINNGAASARFAWVQMINGGSKISGSIINTGTVNAATGLLLQRSIGVGLFNYGTIAATSRAINASINASLPLIVNAAGATISGGTNSISLINTGSVTTVNNSGTLNGAVNLGSLHKLNILGDAAQVVGDTTGTGTSAVTVNGNFTTGGNFFVPTFTVSGGRTTLLHTVSAATSVAAPGILQIGDNTASGVVAGDIANEGLVEFKRSDDPTYAGVISGNGTMNQNGSGVLTLSGNNTYTGATAVNAGTLLLTGALASTADTTVASGATLQVGDGGTTGSLASNKILNDGAVLWNRSDDVTYSGLISGTGSLTQNGPGELTLTADHSFTGGTTVAAGALRLRGSIVSPATVDSGATFSNEGLVDSTIANNGVLNLDGTAARITGAVTGTGVVNVNGTFTSENSFAAGAFNVNGGAVFNMNNGVAAPVTVATGGRLNLLSSQIVDGNILNNGIINVTGNAPAPGGATTMAFAALAAPGANVLTTTGSYTQTAGATFMTAINYIGAGGYGQLKSAQALNVADGAVILAAFASSEKYADGTVVQDVLQGTGTPTKAGKITLFAQNQLNIPRYHWSAVWDGVNVDLVLSRYDGALSLPTLQTVNQNRNAVLGAMHQRFAMLNAVMEYDCAQFDKHGFCLSVQARATGFGLQSTGAGAFNMAYRFADKFRIGGFVDYQATYNSALVGGYTPESVHAYDNRPTFGGYAGFSETGYTSAPLQKGMQLLVSGGVNGGRVSVTRAMLTDAMGYLDAQPGSGTARLDAYYVRGVAGYGLDVGEGLRVMPYVGLRYTDVTRGGYVEGVNALVTQPLAYESFYERLVTGFGGAQVAAMLTPAMGVRAGLGAEVDFKRSANNYSGVSQIPGLAVFSLAHGGSWNGARPAANGGLFYNITPNQRVFLNGATGQQAYTSRGYASGMLGYQAAF